MTRVAVLLAGGSGTRAGLGRNKVLAEVGGRSLLAWSLAAFRDEVDRVVVVARPADRAAIADAVAGQVDAVVDGGATRAASERAGLAAVGSADVVAFHDAARPLVGVDVVRRVLAEADRGRAAVPAVPRTVPVAHWPGEEPVLDDAQLVDRSHLVGVQTPQAAPVELLREVFARDDEEGTSPATDTVEPVLRHRADVPVVAVPGSRRNVKVTWRVDLDLVRRLATQPAVEPPGPALHHRTGAPTGGPPVADLEVDGATPVTDSLRVVDGDGHVTRVVDRTGLVDVAGDLLARDGVLPAADDLAVAVERAVLGGAVLRLRRRR